MIILLITLISLCAIYFTRLLSKKDMRVGAIAVAILYLNLIVWTYAIFVLDVANLGFSDRETQISFLTGSDIYHSFVSITDKMSVIPSELLEAIVAVTVIVLITGFAVAFHGLLTLAKAVVKVSREKELFSSEEGKNQGSNQLFIFYRANSIIRIHCRMNC